MCVCMHECMCVYDACVSMYECMCIRCMNMCMCVYVFMSACTHVCGHLCVFMMGVYEYGHTHTMTHELRSEGNCQVSVLSFHHGFQGSNYIKCC